MSKYITIYKNIKKYKICVKLLISPPPPPGNSYRPVDELKIKAALISMRPGVVQLLFSSSTWQDNKELRFTTLIIKYGYEIWNMIIIH